MPKSISGIFNFFKQKPLVLLAVIIFAQVCVIFYYAGKRSTLHFDEIFVIGQIVANKHQMINKWFDDGKYVPSQQIKDYFRMDKKQRFNYSYVYKESKKDEPIPPLYNFLIYTAYSLHFSFFDDFSIYPGIILNAIFFIFTSILLYFAARFLFTQQLSLLPNLLWGFSTGAINCALCVRIYICAAFFYTALVYVIFSIIKNRQNNTKYFIFLSAAVYFGVLTHYHFLIWIVMVLPVCLIWLAFSKRLKDLLKSAAAAAGAFILAALSYPVVNNLLNSNEAQFARQKIFDLSDTIKNLKLMLDRYCQSFFGFNTDTAVIILIGLAVLFIVWRIDRKSKKGFSASVCHSRGLNRESAVKSGLPSLTKTFWYDNFFGFFKEARLKVTDEKIFVLITALSIAAVPVIIQVSKWTTIRYLWPVGSISVIFFCCIIYYIIRKTLDFSSNAKKIVFAAFICSLAVFGATNRVFYEFPIGDNKNLQLLRQHNELISVCTVADKRSWAFRSVIGELMTMRGSAFIYSDELKNLKEILSGVDISKGFILFISSKPERPDYDAIFEQLKQTGYKEHKFLFKNHYCDVYRIAP